MNRSRQPHRRHSSPSVLVAACTPSSRRRSARVPAGVGPSPDTVRRRSGRRPDLTTARADVDAPRRPRPPTAGPTPSRRPPTPAPAETTIVRAYFFLGRELGTAGLVPVLREVPADAGRRHGRDERAARRPERDRARRVARRSTPPSPTARGCSASTIEDGIATVDLSREFESGGGSASMHGAPRPGRLHADPVPDGRAGRRSSSTASRSRVFGGEGIVLDGPSDRDDYERPAAGDLRRPPGVGRGARQPGRVSGNGQRVRGDVPGHAPRRRRRDARRADRDGDLRHAAARGTFDVNVDVRRERGRSGARSGSGSASAKDGSPEGIREYPVWLTPAS